MFYDGSFIGLAAFNNDWIFYQFNYMPRIITSLFSVGFLSYTVGRRWWLGDYSIISVAAVVWGLIICIIATSARYTQAGFSAANGRDAWKFFAITFVLFIVTKEICGHLGKNRA